MNSKRNKNIFNKTKVIVLMSIFLCSMLFGAIIPITSQNLKDINEATIETEIDDDTPSSAGNVLSWWNETWNYRVRVEIKAQEKTIWDVPMEKRFNFTEFLWKVNDYSDFDENSIRLVEYNQSDDRWILLPCVNNTYHPTLYNKSTNAVFDIFWTINGTMAYNTNRTFFVYFDSISNGNKPSIDYGYGDVSGYTARNTGNLIYNNYFRLADFSAGTWRNERHYGDADNPFDDQYNWPVVEEVDDYEGWTGKWRDQTSRQAHAGYDQRWNMDFYFREGYHEDYFPIMKVAIKSESQTARSALYCLTNTGGWKIIMYTPDAKDTQGTYDSGVDKTYGCEIVCDGKWRIYEYDLRRLTGTYDMDQIEWFQASGAPNTNFLWFDNMMVYKTESESYQGGNRNYLIPESFIYEPEIKKATVEVNAIDLYGNHVTNANISIYNLTESAIPISSTLENDGQAVFTELSHGYYNFTVTIRSEIGNIIELVNITKSAILINKVSQSIDLICNVSRNNFTITDVDGLLLESGWIIVGNDTTNIRNCTIENGHASFWWVNTTPYNYNYSIFYHDPEYNPNTIKIYSDDLTTPNSIVNVPVNMTTINYTIVFHTSGEPIPFADIELRVGNPSGESIANLTTDPNGKLTVRWLNSSGIQALYSSSYQNYSLQIGYGGTFWPFNTTNAAIFSEDKLNFTVGSFKDVNIRVLTNPSDFQTEILSLNPTDDIAIEWGSELKIRALLNVTNSDGDIPIGPSYADSMSYKIYDGANLISIGTMNTDSNSIGCHYGIIDTNSLESDINYLVKISAIKKGFMPPEILTLQLTILENEMILNQSDNDQTTQEAYWLESIDMSVKPYGIMTESLTLQQDIFKDANNQFLINIPEIENSWNLSAIEFNIYNVTFDLPNIKINITDPYGVLHEWDDTNYNYYNGIGNWTDLDINVNKRSLNADNSYEFDIDGSFIGDVDVVAEATFIRDAVNIQYNMANITESIKLKSNMEGWTIHNITFSIENCYDTSTWTKINPKDDANIALITNEGYTYSMDSGAADGTGLLTIDNRTIFPLDNEFSFEVTNTTNIVFEVSIDVDYRQQFYRNVKLEVLQNTERANNFDGSNNFTISPIDTEWDDNGALLLITNINGTEYLSFPSDYEMEITLNSETDNIADGQVAGESSYDLSSLTPSTEYIGIINTNETIDLDLAFYVIYSRRVIYDITGSVNYEIREAPDVQGTVNYNDQMECYVQSIDTSQVDADDYTIRFSIVKEHYISAYRDLSMIVNERLTFINNKPDFDKQITSIYVKDARNFTFSYMDSLTSSSITDLDVRSYIWERYDDDNNVIESGSGLLTLNADDDYALDIDTESLSIGEYLIIVTLDKKNYEYKSAIITLNIIEREMDIKLSNDFKDNQIEVVKGNDLTLRFELTDPTRNDISITDAEVLLTIGGEEFEFEEVDDGIYEYQFTTEEYEAFFTSKTLTGKLKITKEDYETTEMSITIVINMEEGPVPGLPTFYFFMIIGLVAAVGISLTSYRAVQLAKIPTFVKNAREMKKNVKGGKSIPETILYPSKQEDLMKRIGERWKFLGLSMKDTLGLSKSQKKKGAKRKEDIIEKQKGGM